jgi:pimeloyl-ACP methyl ester carboxylesterase
MTMNAKRRRAHDKLAALPGVRAVRRPIRPRLDVAGQAAPGGDQEFDLFYVRTGRKSAHPLVIIPGGPGAASIALYRGFRRRAAAEGLDVIMVERPRVGCPARYDTGATCPRR